MKDDEIHWTSLSKDKEWGIYREPTQPADVLGPCDRCLGKGLIQGSVMHPYKDGRYTQIAMLPGPIEICQSIGYGSRYHCCGRRWDRDEKGVVVECRMCKK
jgi:hypothetical protein